MPIVIDTIGAFIDHGQKLRYRCGDCGNTSEVDLMKLAEKYGRDRSLYTEPRLVFVCGRCGSRDGKAIVSSANAGGVGGAHT